MECKKQKTWRCTVCGYVHVGTEAPDMCPVCGASKSELEPYVETLPSVSPVKATLWQCMNCSFVHEGASPPDACPVCGAEKAKFEAVAESGREAKGANPVKAVIIGGGIAGVSAAETIRKRSPDSDISLIALENELPYYRLNLTRYLSGEITRDALPVYPESWYKGNRIDLICGVSVQEISPDTKNVRLSDGRDIAYEKLILATGSHPYIPSLKGGDLDGVSVLRTSADADRILDMVGKGSRCVCIGGGILGIETAGALARQGADITMLESHEWLMPRQLNRKAAGVLERHMSGLGVKILKNARTQEIKGSGRVAAVLLQGGRSIDAELVILATGVRPNTSLARKTRFEVNTGIVVDNHMRTSQPDVFAAGDAAEHNGQLYGSWAASQYQGGIAALNAVGLPTVFGGLPRSNTVKALGLDLTSIGKFMPEDGSYVVFEQEEEYSYMEFVFRDGKMLGAILVGHPELASPAKKAVEGGRDCSGILQSLPSCGDIAAHLL
ncbi:MAG: FAD-dependent oxidoreductase [Victivallales bacterium]|jgi:nitrite reductase (NADH) large subunit